MRFENDDYDSKRPLRGLGLCNGSQTTELGLLKETVKSCLKVMVRIRARVRVRVRVRVRTYVDVRVCTDS